MLVLASPRVLPRLAYAWQVVGRLLGPLPVGFEVDTRLVGLEVRFEGRCLLALPPPHRLLETGFRECVRPQATSQGLRFEPSDHPLGADLFALVFWFVTEYETHFDFPRDLHSRPVDHARLAVRFDLHHEPLLHREIDRLAEALRRAMPRLPLARPGFSWELGFDLDWPYRYRGRPVAVHVAALLRDLVAFDLSSAKQRLRFLLHKIDPYDVYDFIFTHFLAKNIDIGAHLKFFCLLSAGHRFDTPYTERNPAYRALVAQLAASDAVLGIHPSYESAERPELIDKQVQTLQRLVGQRTLTHSRQHFLRHRSPATYRALLAAGIRHEYTGCFATCSGWRFGTSVPFPWYDLERDEPTALWIHPVAAMDRALRDHECPTPAASLARLVALAQSCRRWGGVFHVLLHNNTLSECSPWEGWRSLVLQLVDQLTSNS